MAIKDEAVVVTPEIWAESIPIIGDKEFVTTVREALILLHGTSAEETVTTYIGRILQHKRSGMNMYSDTPTFEIGSGTWLEGTTWTAGAIAHDSMHAKLYTDYTQLHIQKPPDDVWMGTEAENTCLEFQLKVLIEMDAPQEDIDNIKSMIGTPNYHLIPMEERNW